MSNANMSARRRNRRTGYLDTIEHAEQLNTPIIEQLKREVASIYDSEAQNPTTLVPIDTYVKAFRGLIYNGSIDEGFLTFNNRFFKIEFEDSDLSEYAEYDEFNRALEDIIKDYLKQPIQRGENRDEINLEEIERLEDKTWEEFTEYIGQDFAESVYDDYDAEEPSEDAGEFKDAVIKWLREVRFYDPDDFTVWDDLKFHLFDHDD